MEEEKVKSLSINCYILQYFKISYKGEFTEEQIC